MIKRLAAFISVVALLITAFVMGLFMWYPVRYMDIINNNADGTDIALICAIIHTESKFKPKARSSKGAAGLMQITEGTATWMAAEMGMADYHEGMIMEPAVNIAIGCYYVGWLMDYYENNLDLALCAYNAGLGNVNRWLSDTRYSHDGKSLAVIPFPETDQYLKRVERSRQIYSIILRLWRNG